MIKDIEHVRLSSLDHLERLCDRVRADLHGMAVHVPDGLRPAQQGLLQGHLSS